jgi:hypothetical protein
MDSSLPKYDFFQNIVERGGGRLAAEAFVLQQAEHLDFLSVLRMMRQSKFFRRVLRYADELWINKLKKLTLKDAPRGVGGGDLMINNEDYGRVLTSVWAMLFPNMFDIFQVVWTWLPHVQVDRKTGVPFSVQDWKLRIHSSTDSPDDKIFIAKNYYRRRKYVFDIYSAKFYKFNKEGAFVEPPDYRIEEDLLRLKELSGYRRTVSLEPVTSFWFRASTNRKDIVSVPSRYNSTQAKKKYPKTCWLWIPFYKSLVDLNNVVFVLFGFDGISCFRHPSEVMVQTRKEAQTFQAKNKLGFWATMFFDSFDLELSEYARSGFKVDDQYLQDVTFFYELATTDGRLIMVAVRMNSYSDPVFGFNFFNCYVHKTDGDQTIDAAAAAIICDNCQLFPVTSQCGHDCKTAFYCGQR